VDRSSEADKRGGAADALAYDVITRLAKLRSMFVIAQGTTFALRDRAIGPEEAGRMLNVDYVVSAGLMRPHTSSTVQSCAIANAQALANAIVLEDNLFPNPEGLPDLKKNWQRTRRALRLFAP
jgi:hypothetical protein